MKQLSIIIPAHNEEAAIERTIKRLQETLSSANIDYEIIIVNDASTDNTKEIVERFSEIRIIHHSMNRGYGASLKTGIQEAKFNNLLFFDADDQHKPEHISELLQYSDDFDLISGARTGYKGPAIRQPGKKILHLIANYLTKQNIPDINCGLRIVKKDKIIKYLHLLCDGISFSTTTLLLFITEGHTIKYVPITINRRLGGKSAVKPRHAIDTLILILQIILLSSPLKVFLPITGILILGSIASFLIDMFQTYHTNLHVSITTLFLSISSLLIFFFGLIADQISSLRKEIKK